MRRSRASLAAVLGVMLQVTAGLAAATQVVVCRTPDGHVAIESELSDCCPDAGARLHELSSNACDGCVDTPLFHPSLSPAGKLILGPITASPWFAASAGGHLVLRLPPPPPSGASRPDRTVVLLI